MTIRQWGLIFGLTSSIGFLLYFPQTLKAQSTIRWEANMSYRSEGRDPVDFNVQCGSTSWTTVISTDNIRRSAIFQSIELNLGTVCLRPGTPIVSFSTTTACGQTTPGIHLIPTSTLTDYTMAQWNCRSQTSTNTISGYITRDRGDYGRIGALGAQ